MSREMPEVGPLDDPHFEHDLCDAGRRQPHRTPEQIEAAWSALEAKRIKAAREGGNP